MNLRHAELPISRTLLASVEALALSRRTGQYAWPGSSMSERETRGGVTIHNGALALGSWLAIAMLLIALRVWIGGASLRVVRHRVLTVETQADLQQAKMRRLLSRIWRQSLVIAVALLAVAWLTR